MSSILPGKAGIKQFALMVDGKMVFEAKDPSHAGFSTCSAAGRTCGDRRDGYNKSVVAKSTKLMF